MRRSAFSQRKESSASSTQNPGGHAAIVLHEGGFQRIDEDSVELICEAQQRRLIHKKPFRTIGNAIDISPQLFKVHANAGTQTAEEHSAGFDHAPEFFEHSQKVLIVARKVQYGGAEHHIGKTLREGHLFDPSDLKIFAGQSRAKRSRKLTYVLNRGGFFVDSEDVASAAQQVDQVATITASGIEHDHSGRNVAAQNLIEEVDVDLTELFLKIQRNLFSDAQGNQRFLNQERVRLAGCELTFPAQPESVGPAG